MSKYEWGRMAACLGLEQDLFFPERGEDDTGARAVCSGCPVQWECLDAHIDEIVGVFGGTSARQRRGIRRRLGLIATREPAQCGTRSGAIAHKRNGEPVCAECAEAARDYSREHGRQHRARQRAA